MLTWREFKPGWSLSLPWERACPLRSARPCPLAPALADEAGLVLVLLCPADVVAAVGGSEHGALVAVQVLQHRDGAAHAPSVPRR